MRRFRNLKIASAIEHELARMLARDFTVPDALVTITDVAVDGDLLQAHVKLGIIPPEKEVEVFEALSKRRREFDHALLKRLNLKPMPHLRFEIDKSASAERP